MEFVFGFSSHPGSSFSLKHSFLASLPAHLLLPSGLPQRPTHLRPCPDHLWNGDCYLPAPHHKVVPSGNGLSSSSFHLCSPRLAHGALPPRVHGSGTSSSAAPGARERRGVSSSTQTSGTPISNLTRSLGNSWPHSSLRDWRGWSEKHFLRVCGIYLRVQLPLPSSLLQEDRAGIKGRQQISEMTLQSSVARFHVPTTYTTYPFKETTT